MNSEKDKNRPTYPSPTCLLYVGAFISPLFFVVHLENCRHFISVDVPGECKLPIVVKLCLKLLAILVNL